jgi:hypothetical protein
MKTLTASLLTMLLMTTAAADIPAAVDYRFDDVKRNVRLKTQEQEIRVAKGTHAQSGDRVSTGMFSYALIASDHYKAKFEIYGSTDVQLASGTPGVILSVQRGRLHAIFDKLTGTEPRIVQTPGALLAVRGTKYTVNVDASGDTTLSVFEGIVEVQSEMRREPLLVRAGEESVFGRHSAPSAPRPMPEGRRHDGQGGRENPGGDPSHAPRDGGARRPGDSGGMGHGTGTGQPMPMPMPMPKPPSGRP